MDVGVQVEMVVPDKLEVLDCYLIPPNRSRLTE